MTDDAIIESEMKDIENKVDAKITSFHKELSERIDEIENLEMLLEAEMLQLKELVVGKTDIFFPKELEKRVSLIEEYIASMKTEGSPELAKQIEELQEKIRNLGSNNVVGPELKSVLDEASSKIEELKKEREKLEFLLSKSSDITKAASKVDGFMDAIEAKISRLESMLTSGGIDETVRKSLGLVSDHEKRIGAVESSVSSLAKEISRVDSELKDVEDSIGKIRKSIEYLTEEQMDDIVSEKIEAKLLEKDIPEIEEKFEEIRKRLDYLETVADPSNLVALDRKLREDFEKLESKANSIEKDLSVLKRAREIVQELQFKMNDMTDKWEKIEKAIQTAEDAKNSVISLRDKLRVELESLIMNKIDDATRAMDHKIMHVSNITEQALAGMQNLQQEVDVLSSDIPALKEQMDFFRQITRTTEEHEKSLEKTEKEFQEKLDRMKKEFDSFVDRRILLHLKGVADEMDSKVPELASKAEIEQIQKRLDVLETVVKRIDLSGIKTVLESLYKKIAELEEKSGRRPERTFPFMIE